MGRRGLDQVTVRLEDEVLAKLRQHLADERGRAGGVALYLRKLVYQDLGLPLPPQYGRQEPRSWAPSLVSRVQAWLENEVGAPEDLAEAARLVARAAGLEVLDGAEVRRLKRAAAEADRLRKQAPAAPSSPPLPPPDFQEGRRRGLLEAAGLADGLAARLRGSSQEVKQVEGLEAAARLARALAEEIGRHQEQRRDLAESVKGTRYADPDWLRSSAWRWRQRLAADPQDSDARLELGRVERIAEALGVDLAPEEKPRRRGGGRGRKG